MRCLLSNQTLKGVTSGCLRVLAVSLFFLVVVSCQSRRANSTRTTAPALEDASCSQIWHKAQSWEQSLQAGTTQTRGQLKKRARSFADCEDSGRVAFAMGQALLWGRVAQGRGLSGLSAFRKAESWAAKAFARDPEFQRGLPRRVLGSMWALGGRYLPGRDSEAGIELLAEQTKRYPQDAENVLRLVQALAALGDLEGGHGIYCSYTKHPSAWTKLHVEGRKLLDELRASFQNEDLACPASEV